MAKLTLRLNGKIIQSLELEAGKEYFAGRAAECDFVLDDYRGISRQHLKIHDNNGSWYCESLSKFLHPKLGEENFESLEMNENIFFSLPPYDFEFEIEAAQASPQPTEEPDISPHALVPIAQPPSGFDSSEFDEDASDENFSDMTAVAAIQLTSLLRISYPSSSDNETLKLEGQVWTAGRESDCEIQLHNPKVSRKHFELNKNEEGYFITDLGSSNGTYLNGQRIPPHEPTKIVSGDQLRVLDIDLHFEIKAANLPAVTAQPLALGQIPMPVPMPMGHWPVPAANNLPGPYEYDATHIGQVPPLSEEAKGWRNFDWKKNKVRIALLAFVPILLFGLFSESDKTGDGDQTKIEGGNINVSFDNLPAEQKTAIKDSIALARNLYVQGKYSLCLAELAKLHETIPFYDNSKELESFCIQGHELTQRKLDNDRKEREKAMVEQQISDITATCSEKFSNKGTVAEVRQCLSGAFELNPNHPKIIELVQKAEDRLREKELLAQREQELAAKRREILGIFQLAERLKSKGDMHKAVSTYERFIARADNSFSTQRATARREVASISKSIREKVDFFLDKCRSLGESGKLREAYEACDDALKEDNSIKEAHELKERFANSLRRQMKSIYQDAKLEESLGNLESAKEKWKKIRAEDLSDGDFSKRATIKLRQYGAI